MPPARSAEAPVGSTTAAAALVACLFVTVGCAEPAIASVDDRRLAATVDAQRFRAPRSVVVEVGRDRFGVGMAVYVVRPVDGTVPTAGGFGSRHVHGCAACSTDHQGLDFAASLGTPVRAAMGGLVLAAGAAGGYGQQVLLQHADGTRTRYAHLSAVDVHEGQSVDAGQTIGAVGSTGVSTGAHLHYEVIIDGRPVDPAAWLRERGLL